MFWSFPVFFESHEPLARCIFKCVKKYSYIVFMFWLHKVDILEVLKKDMPITKSDTIQCGVDIHLGVLYFCLVNLSNTITFNECLMNIINM